MIKFNKPSITELEINKVVDCLNGNSILSEMESIQQKYMNILKRDFILIICC